jgi:hypothetical protein
MLWALALTHAGNRQKEDQDRMPIPVDGQRVAKRLDTWAAIFATEGEDALLGPIESR